MIITLHAKDLAAATAAVSAACAAKPTVPITAGIRVTPVGETAVRLSAFDYDQSISMTIPAEVDGTEAFVVSGRLLANIAKVLPVRRPVELALSPGKLHLTSGSTSFTLPTLDPEDWPQEPEANLPLGVVDTAALAGLVTRIAHAASREANDVRLSAIGSVLLEADAESAQITACATDRRQFATGLTSWQPAEGMEGTTKLLVPAVSMLEILGGVTEPMVTVCTNEGGGLIGLACAGYVATMRLFDGGEFPPGWRRLLPSDAVATARVEASEILAMLHRAAAVIDKKVVAKVDLSIIEDSIALTVDGVIADEVDAVTTGEGECGVNVDYISESLGSINAETLTIHLLKNNSFHLAEGHEGDLTTGVLRTDYEVVLAGIR